MWEKWPILGLKEPILPPKSKNGVRQRKYGIFSSSPWPDSPPCVLSSFSNELSLRRRSSTLMIASPIVTGLRLKWLELKGTVLFIFPPAHLPSLWLYFLRNLICRRHLLHETLIAIYYSSVHLPLHRLSCRKNREAKLGRGRTMLTQWYLSKKPSKMGHLWP